jgi:DNA-binding transcriptional regulator LsrR (DeoR family)
MAGDRHYLKLHPEKIGYGEDAPNSTLTTEIVIAIRQRYAEGWPQKQIAKQFNLATSTIYKIVHRQRWPHLPGGDAQATTVICPHCGKELSRRFGNDQRHIQSCGYGEGR